MNPLTAVKYGLIAVLVAFVFYLGTLREKGKMDRDHADMAQSTAAALIARQNEHDTELKRVNTVLRTYEATSIDPVIPGIAGRLLKYTLSGCSLQAASPDPVGPGPGPRVPGGDPELKRLSQEAFNAAGRDSKRIIALRAAWPRV